jgi:hypothetical protein
MTKPLLERQRLGARPYSLSALQKYASCPYQFLLSAIHRLQRPRDIEPLQKLDPLTRGSIFHEAQAAFFRQLSQERRLPLTAAAIPQALETLDAALARVAADYEETLAPAIERTCAYGSAACRRPAAGCRHTSNSPSVFPATGDATPPASPIPS